MRCPDCGLNGFHQEDCPHFDEEWTPQWIYRQGKLVPYCSPGFGSATKVHPPHEGQLLVPLDSIFEEADGEPIPRDYWREVPCGHSPDPVAMRGRDGEPVCHCGTILDQQDGIEVEAAPGPVVLCSKCGCHVAVPIFEEADDA